MTAPLSLSHSKTLDVCGSLACVIFCPRAVQQSCTGTVTNTRHSKHNNQSFVRKMYSEMLKMKYMNVGLQFDVLYDVKYIILF